jgi:N-acetyl-gamma-glutamyl-phosphate reductase
MTVPLGSSTTLGASTAPASGVGPANAPSSAAPSVRTGERITTRVAVLGASGYSGQEFARLALGHPGLKLSVLASREHAGRPAAELLPGIDPRAVTLPIVAEPRALVDLLADGIFDTLVCCLPHGAWQTVAAEHPALAAAPARIIDLSSDFRAGGAHPGGEDYLYGLPEAFRTVLAGATRIANPGCYPTAATLALLPAAENGWLEEPVMVSALSGVSGAGRSPALKTSFVELEGGASIYKAGAEHQHVPEMERNLERLAGSAISVGFVPQLAPMARGILLTANARLARPVTPEEARAAYLARYENEPFVRVLEPGAWPETRAVKASNRCDLAVTTLHGGRTLLATAALDNLVKGAAGQALQNLNLMLGWPESWGLPVHGSPW